MILSGNTIGKYNILYIYCEKGFSYHIIKKTSVKTKQVKDKARVYKNKNKNNANIGPTDEQQMLSIN